MPVVQVEGHTRDVVGDRATAGSVTYYPISGYNTSYYPISGYNTSLIPCAGIRVAVGNLGNWLQRTQEQRAMPFLYKKTVSGVFLCVGTTELERAVQTYRYGCQCLGL